ncbi:uncharacterized protein LOC130743639 [Lotus japonicus]|uniref:uncharacterized protein LOC130743639 n=1 Tax=Lotus japonicus TaxID=34305 RepID=UPI002583BFD3|nr:uncharacterized protein LOC130743639 [Lotus japonicus]
MHLRNKQVDVDPCCPVCGEEDETIEHLFLRCHVSRSCWFVKLGVRIDPGTLFTDFMREVLQQRDSWVVAEVQNMIYCLWEARNRWLFEERKFDFAMVIARTQTLGIVAPVTANAGEEPRHGKATWSRPAASVIKVNVDASMGRDNLAGFGFVARDGDGEILAAGSKYPSVASSSTIAEALGLRWVMEISSQLGFRRVQFETDSLQLYYAWKKGTGRSVLFSVIHDCISFLSLFDFVDLSFVRRQGNACADFMARNASTLSDVIWIEEGPPGLFCLLQADLLASVPVLS